MSTNLINIERKTEKRTEFGFTRTVCDCRACSINCEYIPGYLVPADLTRLREHIGPTNWMGWAESHLLASPGAGVVAQGRAMRIPTIVPARSESGGCIFLVEGRCGIHAIAPFGCAFFDAHQTKDHADEMSMAGFYSIVQDIEREGEYSSLWCYLKMIGRVAERAEVNRQRMAIAYVNEITS